MSVVDDKQGRLLATLHATNRDLYPAYISETREILLKVDYGRWTIIHFITYAYTHMERQTSARKKDETAQWSTWKRQNSKSAPERGFVIPAPAKLLFVKV